MTNINQHRFETLQSRFGVRVAARLSESAIAVPHDVSERLRAARVRAVAQRKPETSSVVGVSGQSGSASLVLGQGFPGLWNWVASSVPLVALVVGLVAIDSLQQDRIASEVAEVDVALLVDDLPPAAYADPGFAQFLKAGRPAQP
ncbi:MAG: DUF3619 family protein [Ramlibacter sp.]|jgi:hypothetical protein|nr:DUF3619 family protein [Ramlibacter sp.]